MHDIFISYSREDYDYMIKVCRQFESPGLKCWYDTYTSGIETGQFYTYGSY